MAEMITSKTYYYIFVPEFAPFIKYKIITATFLEPTLLNLLH